jgi:EPS-associated MarR family transcriptional regulator
VADPRHGSIASHPLNEELRFRLLRLLVEQPEINQRQLAQTLGLSLGKVNYCLRALVDKGWVKVENFRSSGNKLGYAYVLTPSGLRARARATVDFLRRKQDEYAALEREIAELRREAARLQREEAR